MGLLLKGGQGGSVEDITVKGGTEAAISISDRSDVQIRRVRLLESTGSGLLATGSPDLVVETSVLAGNGIGVTLQDSPRARVINSTVAANQRVALILTRSEEAVVFNNLITDSVMGVVVSSDTEVLHLDHNGYKVDMIGVYRDVPPKTTFSWRDQTGWDQRSLSLPIAYVDTDSGIYRNQATLNWRPDRSSAAGWGVKQFAGVAAPKADINGLPWSGGVAVGAWGDQNLPFTALPATGTVTVGAEGLYTSAALYDEEGMQVAVLFQLLPLPKGEHAYWLPTRDWQWRGFDPGEYELRTISADLRLEPVGEGWIGNKSPGLTRELSADILTRMARFDSQGRIITIAGWNERGLSIRAFDEALKTFRWSLPGTAVNVAFALDGRGQLIVASKQGNSLKLILVDEETGLPVELTKGIYSVTFTEVADPDSVGGMGVLGETLFVLDATNDQVLVIDLNTWEILRTLPAKDQRALVTDADKGRLWLLDDAGQRITVMNPDSPRRPVANLDLPVGGVQSFDLKNGRLALLSHETGQVHVFTVDEARALSPLFTLGSGADFRSKIADPNDFVFLGQEIENGMRKADLDADGNVLVNDRHGWLKRFSPDGELVDDLVGGWFNSFWVSREDKDGTVLINDRASPRLVNLNTRTGQWHYTYPGDFTLQLGRTSGLKNTFSRDGKTYGLFEGRADEAHPRNDGTVPRAFNVIARIDDGATKFVPLVGFSGWNNEFALITDFSEDLQTGFAEKRWQPQVDAEGNSLIEHRRNSAEILPNGDIVLDNGNHYVIVPLEGFGSDGMPRYNWANPRIVEENYPSNLVSIHDASLSAFHRPHSGGQANPPNRIITFWEDGTYAKSVGIPGPNHRYGGRRFPSHKSCSPPFSGPKLMARWTFPPWSASPTWERSCMCRSSVSMTSPPISSPKDSSSGKTALNSPSTKLG